MVHPNCRPTEDMRMVTAAANQAAERNREWEEVAISHIIGVSGRGNRRVVTLYVAFGGMTRVFYLSAGGVIFRKMGTREYVPLDLAELSSTELWRVREVLATIGR